MPSPRAVLADITDFKLDPTVAHTTVRGSGRLSKQTTNEAPSVTKEKDSAKVVVAEAQEKKVVKEVEETVATVVEDLPKVDVEEKKETVEDKLTEKSDVVAEAEETTKKRGGGKKSDKVEKA